MSKIKETLQSKVFEPNFLMEVPQILQELMKQESVFFYDAPFEIPHTACGPVWVTLPNAGFPEVEDGIRCHIWMSHLGTVLTLQPLDFAVSIGIYTKDVAEISPVLALHHRIHPRSITSHEEHAVHAVEHGHATGTPPPQVDVSHLDEEAEREANEAATHAQAVDGPTWYCDVEFYCHSGVDNNLHEHHIAIRLGLHSEMEGQLFKHHLGKFRVNVYPDLPTGGFIGNIDPKMEYDMFTELERIQRLVSASSLGPRHFELQHKCDQQGPVQIDQLQLQYQEHLDRLDRRGEHEDGGEWDAAILPHFEGPPIYNDQQMPLHGFCLDDEAVLPILHGHSVQSHSHTHVHLSHARSSLDLFNPEKTTHELTSSQEDYDQCFTEWCASKDARKMAEPSNALAAKAAYQFWSPVKIAKTIIYREHFVPKMFKRVPPVTRGERYMFLATGMQWAFTVQTMLFRGDCVMVPKPAVCAKKKGSFLNKFAPTWMTVFASLFGLCMAVPLPLICLALFRKLPRMEKMEDWQKRRQLWKWQIGQTIGWCFLFCLHGFMCYWMIVFSNHFNAVVFEKWADSALQSLLGRFFYAPAVRGGVFSVVLILSQCIPLCDNLLAFFPHLLPAEVLQGTPRQPTEAEISAGLGMGDSDDDDEVSDMEDIADGIAEGEEDMGDTGFD